MTEKVSLPLGYGLSWESYNVPNFPNSGGNVVNAAGEVILSVVSEAQAKALAAQLQPTPLPQQVAEALEHVDASFSNVKACHEEWEILKLYISRSSVTEDFLDMALDASWDGGDLDGGTIQDSAEAYGLIQRVECTEENRSVWQDLEGDFDVGSYFYRKTKLGYALQKKKAA